MRVPKKLLAIVLALILISSSILVVFKFVLLKDENAEKEYTRPFFETTDEVDEKGKLVDVDYEEIEANLKTYENPDDKDNDNISDNEEKSLGFNPFSKDTDGDGLSDEDESKYSCNPLIYDTDIDGLSDGEEIYNYSTNATIPDTDGDFLLDGEEIFSGTNPLDSDSDDDQVKDGAEVKWNEDIDIDGKINALDSDSDGDALSDGKEINTYFTDMINSDSDNDGLNDYYEAEVYATDPNIADTDSDGLIDSKEAYDCIFYEAETCLSSGAALLKLETKNVAYPSEATGDLITHNQKLTPGKYKIMFFSKISKFSSSKDEIPKLKLDITISFPKTEILYLPIILDSLNNVKTEFRWVSSNPFEITSTTIVGFDVDMIDYALDEAIVIDSFMIVKINHLNRSFTNPLDSDTDDDGIIDGKEASEDALWAEAEDFVFDEDYILQNHNASNGKLVSTTHLALADLTTLVTIETNSKFPKGYYSLFIRGYSSWWSILDVKITYNDDGNTKSVTGTYEMNGGFPRGLWVATYFSDNEENLKFELPNPSNIKIEISTTDASKTHPLSIDEIAFVKMTYKKPSSMMMSELPGLVPRLLTNPLDPDTDGDQYRKEIGHINGEDCQTCATMLSLTGYLTDNFELTNGLNPMSLDTDSDNLDDNTDPNPLGLDADDDGIPDYFEDVYPENMPDGIYQSDYENTDWCNPDTDRDRVIDGNEDWDFDTTVDDGETDPASPDTDGDGLLDGGSTLSPVLLNGLNHDYTTTIGSAQYQYLASKLNKVNDSGILYDPWFVSGTTVTFIGEIDKSTDSNDIDSDDDLIEDGVEVFVYKTNPTKQDTDGDTYTDYEEIFIMGTDPLVADWPDLTVKSITMDPLEPEIDWWNETCAGVFKVDIENIGKVDAFGKIQIKLSSNGHIISKTIQDLGTGQTKQVEFDYEAVDEKYYSSYHQAFPYTIIYKPGRFTADAKIETQNPEQWYGEKVTETSYTNNQKSYNVTIRGANPKAILRTNLTHNWIMTGESIAFSYSGQDPDGTISKYEIDFEGDGIYDFTDAQQGCINHTYEETSYIGTERAYFTAALKVTDDDNKTDITYITEIAVSPSLSDDSDGDGLSNYDEIYIYGTNRDDADFDQDNLNDYQEIMIYKTNPFDDDSDGDGIRDDVEIIVAGFYGLNATQDADGDGLPNNLDADSDNDRILDGRELSFSRPDGLEPAIIQMQDVTNWVGTNPYYSDTDYDGISDAAEEATAVWGVNNRPHLYLNSVLADSDRDGLNDYEEVYVYATASDKQDTDEDGLEDGIDLQPSSGVVTMNILEEEYTHYSYTHAVEGEYGVRWTRYYPAHMLQFDTNVRLCGIDGNSWDTWGEDEDLGNEGVMDSDLSSSSVWDLGFGDFEVYGYEYLNDGALFGLPYATLTSGTRFDIRYQLKGLDYKLYLWNNKITKDPNSVFYTAWDVGLKSGYNNSIEFQFKILDSTDKYDISSEENFYIPAFVYKLFTKGDDGLKFSDSGESPSLVYKDVPVFEGIAQATEIKDKNHWYYIEIKLPKEHVTSNNMFVVLQPVWLKADGQEYLNPKNLKFASLSKLVYYESLNEKLRIGCRTFNELHNAISKPSSWDGQKYNNYTSVRKIDNISYFVTEVESIKKALRHESRWDIAAPHTILEKVISIKTYAAESIDDFNGELGTNKYKSITDTLSTAAPNSVFATDYKFAMIRFSETNLVTRDIKWFTTSKTSDFISEGLAPMIFENAKHIKFKANAVCAVVLGTVDIIISGVKYLNTNNPILERQYAEEMWASGVSIALNLIPYWFFVELGVRVIVYAVEWIVGWPEDVNIGTLSDPGALIVFAVEYLIVGSIPSDLAKKALKDACNILMDEVERMNLLRFEGEKFYVFIPPS